MNKIDSNSKKQVILLNEKIKFPTVTVIDQDGNKLGEMQTSKAINLAQSQGLDLLLVTITPDKKAVTKILDYGKYKFDKQKKLKENRKNQNSSSKLKEIKVKPMIGDHDLSFRIENAKKWLSQKSKVRFVIEARGRMSLKIDFINDIYKKFSTAISEFGTIVQENKKINQFRYETLIDPK